MSGRRVAGERIDVDPQSFRDFFSGREVRTQSQHPLTSVLYQDDQPELARARDTSEKERLLPVINAGPGNVVLDIACGIGRWATPLINEGARYVGLDFTPGLLRHALKVEPRGTFHLGDAAQLSASQIRAFGPPDRILIAGALIYLNDTAVEGMADAIGEGASHECRVVLREPTALQERLTLESVDSAELKSRYSAIYRTRDELVTGYGSCLETAGFTLIQDQDLFDDDSLNNRVETRQRFYVWERAL